MKLLVYPTGFAHATCPCDACTFPEGRERTVTETVPGIDGAPPLFTARTVRDGYGDCKQAIAIDFADPPPISDAAAYLAWQTDMRAARDAKRATMPPAQHR